MLYAVVLVWSVMPGDNNPLPRLVARKARTGCLGCLWQCALVLVVGSILLIALTGLFYPWSFYLGGRFHILPAWQGWGRAHAQSGDYLLWLYFWPTPRGSKMYLETNLTGDAYVCTPRGENIRLRLGGGTRKHLNLSTDGEPIHFYMFYRPWNGAFVTERRPRIELRGNWRNPNLLMNDEGSINRAFQSDGSVYRGTEANRPYATNPVPITFAQGSYSDFEKACGAVRH
jgi:hypothetical protein